VQQEVQQHATFADVAMVNHMVQIVLHPTVLTYTP
jgi:hypothetical protein